MLLQMFRTMLSDNTELSDEKINELVGYIYEYTSDDVENTTASGIKSEY